MSCLKSSTNYVWDISYTLGTGATGAVYQGMHSLTGEPVAIKSFGHRNRSRPTYGHVQMKEFANLRGLNHPNIVKMLAIEEEVETKMKVLVMELCAGGSLYAILEDPQNNCGLEETEFLQVLHDVSAGMKYLRENDMVHRDLKPGNIMKFIGDDQKCIFKLIDFGSARQLAEDGQFESMHGTEEYLHPDLYEKAVLKKPSKKVFRATVDLWSIGVTLYHIATGHLPFRPHGGRNNTKTMFRIISTKETNVISGVQHTENAPIEWATELPNTCRLNYDIRELLTKLLAGILEKSEIEMWTYDLFFDQIADIVSRKPIPVFYMNRGKELTLYMQPDQKLVDVKNKLCEQLKVLPADQLLLFNNSVFDNVDARVDTYPKMSCTQPLIILSNKISIDKHVISSGTPKNCFPNFDSSNQIDFEHDASQAKCACSVAHALKRVIQKHVRCRELLVTTPKVLLDITYENVTKLCSNLDSLKQKLEDINHRFGTLEKSLSTISMLLKNWPVQKSCDCEQSDVAAGMSEKHQKRNELYMEMASLQSGVRKLKQRVSISSDESNESGQSASGMADKIGSHSAGDLANTLSAETRDSIKQFSRKKVIDKDHKKEEIYEEFLSLQSAVNNLRQRVIITGQLKNELDQEISVCPELICCVEKADTSVNRMRDSWQLLLKDKNTRERNGRILAYDEKFHILERRKIQQTSEKLFDLQVQCVKSCQHMFESLDTWLSGIQATMDQCKLVDKEGILYLMSKANTYATALTEAEAKADELYQQILSWLTMDTSHLHTSPNYSSSNFQNVLNSISSDESLSHIGNSVDVLCEEFAKLKKHVLNNDYLIERLMNCE